MSKAKTTRLTNGLRADISENVINGLFAERARALVTSDTALAARLLNWYVEPRHQALMKQLPSYFFATMGGIRYQTKEQSGVKVEYGEVATSEGLRVPADLGNYGRIHLPATHGLWKEIRASVAECTAIHNDKKILKEKIYGLMAGVSTVKALVAAWPEVTEYLPEFEEKLNVPAVRAEELNDFILKLKK